MKYYDKVLSTEPNNELALIKKGDILLYKNDIKESLKYYEKVLKLNKNNEEALLGKGVCNYKLNNINEGIFCFDKILEINKENKNSLINKAIILFNKQGEKKLFAYQKVKKKLIFYIKKDLLFMKTKNLI